MYAHLQAFQLVADYQTPGANLSPGSIDGSYRQDTAPNNQGKLYPDNFNTHCLQFPRPNRRQRLFRLL